MSSPPEHDNGRYGANSAYGAPGAHVTPGGIRPTDVPGMSPNVYHPRVESSPRYEAYADPATAHGWQNAYDETTELPPVVEGADGAHEDCGAGGGSGPGGGYDYVYEDGHGYDYDAARDAGRGSPRSHRGRHQPGVWRSRRVAVVAGVVGAVSVGALIAGFSLSGPSSTGGTKTKGDRTATTSDDSVVPGEPSVGTSPGTRRSEDADPPRTTSPSASASPTVSDEAASDAAASDDSTEEPSTDPTAAGTAPSAPTATVTATATATGTSADKPGRGQGNTKRPK